ncbi:MAG: hypothetical protein ACPGVP_19200 [Thiolinea sp.]
MNSSDTSDNHTLSVIVCNSCQLVTVAKKAGKRCSGCGDTLPEPLELPSLTATPRYVGTLSILKPLADKANNRMEATDMVTFRDHPTTTEAFRGATICGWCSSQYTERPQTPNCPNCGGLLPKPPGIDPGSLPPAPPRQLPKQFSWNIFAKKNLGLWIGVGLTGVGILFPLLLPVGIICAYANLAVPLRRHKSLRKGKETIGVISRVSRYADKTPPTAKNQPAESTFSVMYAVNFRFKVNGELLEGIKYTYDPAVQSYMIGEPIWVVYCPGSIKAYDLWPPLA